MAELNKALTLSWVGGCDHYNPLEARLNIPFQLHLYWRCIQVEAQILAPSDKNLTFNISIYTKSLECDKVYLSICLRFDQSDSSMA